MQVEKVEQKIVDFAKKCGLSDTQIAQTFNLGANQTAKFEEFLPLLAETLHQFETENDKELFMNFISNNLMNLIKELKRLNV